MDKVLIYIEDSNKFHFFKKFKEPLSHLNYELLFITNRLSIYIKSKVEKIDTYLIRFKQNKVQSDVSLDDTYELISGKIKFDEGLRLYTATFSVADNLMKKFNIAFCFLFNGTNICSKAIKDAASGLGIPLFFFELSNIKGKIFIDPIGTNTRSLLFKYPEILEEFFEHSDEFPEWRAKYFESKMEQSNLPQAVKKKQITNWMLPLDWVGFKFLGFPKNLHISLLSKIREKFIKPLAKVKYDNPDLKSEKYIFFPLQLSDDSQLLLDAKISIQDAFEQVLDKQQTTNHKLIIKFHPMENNTQIIEEFIKLREKYGFLIVNRNSYDLLKNAQYVITINSTLGLEARLLNKKVYFLGDTIYNKISNNHISTFVMKYLINIDFFSNEIPEVNSVKELISRSNLIENYKSV